jgi:hypothetical protein
MRRSAGATPDANGRVDKTGYFANRRSRIIKCVAPAGDALNAQYCHVLRNDLCDNDFNQIIRFHTHKLTWDILQEIHESSSLVKDSKLIILLTQLAKFKMSDVLKASAMREAAESRGFAS